MVMCIGIVGCKVEQDVIMVDWMRGCIYVDLVGIRKVGSSTTSCSTRRGKCMSDVDVDGGSEKNYFKA